MGHNGEGHSLWPQGKENQAGSGSKQSEVVGKGSAWGSEKEDSALGDDPRLGPRKQAGWGGGGGGRLSIVMGQKPPPPHSVCMDSAPPNRTQRSLRVLPSARSRGSKEELETVQEEHESEMGVHC